MNKLLQQWFCKPRMPRRLIVLFISIILMGFCVSVFQQISFGTDPCAIMTQGFHLTSGITYGTCQFLVNLAVLVVILLLKNVRYLGIGSIVNMGMVGYAVDLGNWIINHIHPLGGEPLWMKILIFLPTMGVFLMVVAFYTVVDLGTAPYDAFPQVLADLQKKIPYAPIRMVWDILCATIGFLLGGTVGVVTVFVCFFMGPVIALICKKFQKYF